MELIIRLIQCRPIIPLKIIESERYIENASRAVWPFVWPKNVPD